MTPPQSPPRPILLQWVAAPLFWFIIALLIRLLYMLDQAGTSPLFYVPLLDEEEAMQSARAILDGQANAEPWFKAPGYSWILAAILAISGEAWPWILRLAQHTAGAGLVCIAARLAGTISPTASARTLATAATGFLAATYAPLIRLEENISLDFWVVFFQSAMLLILASAFTARNLARPVLLRCLTAGVLAAAAWITRPTITAILPFLALWLLIVPRLSGITKNFSIKPAAIFLLPILLLATATATRNHVVSGEALVLPWQGGYNLYHANKPGATGRYFLQDQLDSSASANPTYGLAIEGFRQSLPPDQRTAWDNAPVYSSVNSYWNTKAQQAIADNPVQWAGLMSKKLIYLFSDKEIFNYEDFDLHRKRSTILRLMPTTFGIVFPLALASIIFAPALTKRRRSIILLIWIYTLTLSGAIALYYVSGRMRMPIAFPMIVLAGQFLAMLPQLKKIPRPRQVAAAILLIIGAVISYGDWWGVRSESMAHADLARMSNAAWKRGRYQEALDFALQAEQLVPTYPALPRLKGQALYYLGELPAARREFEKSLLLLNDETSRNNITIIDNEIQKRATTPQPPNHTILH